MYMNNKDSSALCSVLAKQQQFTSTYTIILHYMQLVSFVYFWSGDSIQLQHARNTMYIYERCTIVA